MCVCVQHVQHTNYPVFLLASWLVAYSHTAARASGSKGHSKVINIVVHRSGVCAFDFVGRLACDLMCVYMGEREEARVKWFTPRKIGVLHNLTPLCYLVATLFTSTTRCTRPGIHLGRNLATYKRAVHWKGPGLGEKKWILAHDKFLFVQGYTKHMYILFSTSIFSSHK